MTLTDRISKVCADKKIRNINLVKLGCGSKQTVSAIRNGIQNPSFEFLEIFLKVFTDIDARWLITGEEDMLVEEPRVQYGFCKECLKKEGDIFRLEKVLDTREELIKEKERHIEELNFKLGEKKGLELNMEKLEKESAVKDKKIEELLREAGGQANTKEKVS